MYKERTELKHLRYFPKQLCFFLLFYFFLIAKFSFQKLKQLENLKMKKIKNLNK